MILEAGETNRDTFQEPRQEFSRTSTGKQNKPTDRQTGQPDTKDLDEIIHQVNDNNSATFSARTVSPSSRTNIPPDIWAELRGEVLHDGHVITRSNLDLLSHEKVHTKGKVPTFHSSLGLTVYSYAESSWKRVSGKPPRSFLCKRTSGSYSQTVLPTMPASLTVVPVSYVTRPTSRASKSHEFQVDQSASIRMPRVPAVSPVPDSEVTMPDCTQTSQTSTIPSKGSEFYGSTSEGIEPEHKYEDEEVLDEVEYIIAREVISQHEVGENFAEYGEDLCKEVGDKASLVDLGVSHLSKSKENIEQIETMDSVPFKDKKSSAPSLNESENSIGSELLHSQSLQHKEKPSANASDETAAECLKDDDTEASLNLQHPVKFDEEKSQDNTSRISNSSHYLEAQASQRSLNGESSVRDLTTNSRDLDSTRDVTFQESFEQIQHETLNKILVSKESSDFKLEPYNVESDLLQPIHIESDLLLLSGDSFLDLTSDEAGEDNVKESNSRDGGISAKESSLFAESSKNSTSTENLGKYVENDVN